MLVSVWVSVGGWVGVSILLEKMVLAIVSYQVEEIGDPQHPVKTADCLKALRDYTFP